ncbi:MAG: hypothetical protein Q8861_11710 [Bacteroidota bacterium]|nr:hypothetical protein [Bacteroidota bacterium]
MKFQFCAILLLIAIGFIGCNSDLPIPNNINIVGRWIARDTSDTLTFDASTGMVYHSNASIHNEQYKYQLKEDSITLIYAGSEDNYSPPTTHLYYMNKEYLSIDFKNTRCYGFSQKVMNFLRTNNN